MRTNQIGASVAVCCLLALCEPAASDDVYVDVIEPLPGPTLEPTATLTPFPTPSPTGLPEAILTCTPMPWPTHTPTATPEIVYITGRASQYAEGVMERVIRTRQGWGQLPSDVSGYDGYVAGRECGDIGYVVWLRQCEAKAWETFLIVDCASKTDHQSEDDARSGYEWMTDMGILFEVDYETAKRWDTVRQMVCIDMLISGGIR